MIHGTKDPFISMVELRDALNRDGKARWDMKALRQTLRRAGALCQIPEDKAIDHASLPLRERCKSDRRQWYTTRDLLMARLPTIFEGLLAMASEEEAVAAVLPEHHVLSIQGAKDPFISMVELRDALNEKGGTWDTHALRRALFRVGALCKLPEATQEAILPTCTGKHVRVPKSRRRAWYTTRDLLLTCLPVLGGVPEETAAEGEW